MQRHLYLAAYDITDPKRLHRMLVAVKGYATGGQKSVFECWLSAGEHHDLRTMSAARMDLDEDRFFLIRLDLRQRPMVLGLALPPSDPRFYYQG
ncbi:MAG: CRISPR-associated endonuclease Cas2 [Mariprofundales bacterium]|nr:CRISPR-associated endonuclease Cas2 [Mariprofundales bacterium]